MDCTARASILSVGYGSEEKFVAVCWKGCVLLCSFVVPVAVVAGGWFGVEAGNVECAFATSGRWTAGC